MGAAGQHPPAPTHLQLARGLGAGAKNIKGRPNINGFVKRRLALLALPSRWPLAGAMTITHPSGGSPWHDRGGSPGRRVLRHPARGPGCGRTHRRARR